MEMHVVRCDTVDFPLRIRDELEYVQSATLDTWAKASIANHALNSRMVPMIVLIFGRNPHIDAANAHFFAHYSLQGKCAAKTKSGQFCFHVIGRDA